MLLRLLEVWELLGVPEVMRFVLLEVPQVMRCVLGTLYAGGSRGWVRFLDVLEVQEEVQRTLPRLSEVLVAGVAGGDTLCAALFIGGVGGDGDDALYATTLPAGGVRGIGSTGGDTLCTTLYAGGAGGETLCAALFAGGLEVPEVMRCMILCLLEVIRCVLLCIWRCRR